MKSLIYFTHLWICDVQTGQNEMKTTIQNVIQTNWCSK